MAIPRPHELKELIEFLITEGPYTAATKSGTESSTFATARARITDQGGSIDAIDQQHQSQTQEFEIWTRYIDGLTGFMEISWGTRSLTITGPPQKVVDSQGRRWWVIRAEEVTERSL